jgi:Chaperone of endosialidase
MHPLIQFKNATALCLVMFALVWFGLSPIAQAADETTSNFNTGEGIGALQSVTTGAANTAVGFDALFTNMTGNFNTATGIGALFNNTAGRNTATGAGALFTNGTGTQNTADGVLALSMNTSGSNNTAVGDSALQSDTADDNTAVGFQALSSNGEGTQNTAVGKDTLLSNTGGIGNTALGYVALSQNPAGNDNTAVGSGALANATAGSDNTAVGLNAMTAGARIGNFNIAIGSGAGFNLTTGSHNIDIYDAGVSGDDSTIRIGTQGTQTKTFIAGINGANEGSPTAVFINTTTGQLGTTAPASSRRFKKEIRPMDKTSEAILALKPVTFQYKSDHKNLPQFGLIAEEVAAVNPDLIVRDDKGEIYTVRYDAVNAMLLNEFLKEHRTVERLEKQVKALSAGLQKVSAQLELSKAAPQTVLNDQ